MNERRFAIIKNNAPTSDRWYRGVDGSIERSQDNKSWYKSTCKTWSTVYRNQAMSKRVQVDLVTGAVLPPPQPPTKMQPGYIYEVQEYVKRTGLNLDFFSYRYNG